MAKSAKQAAGAINRVKRKPEMSDAQRLAIWSCCECNMENVRLRRGEKKRISEYFDVHPRTVTRIIARAQKSLSEGKLDVSSQKHLTGRKPKYDIALLKKKFALLPAKHRKTMRDSAHALKISTTTFFRYTTVKKYFRPCSIATRPKLTALHRTNRLQFVRNEIAEDGHFKSQFNKIHIDEKWFYEMQDKERVYLVDGEKAPDNVARHKSHYNKAMFLAAVARPWKTRRSATAASSGEYNVNAFDDYSDDGKWFFDGKVGIYPVVQEVAAKRNSFLRPAGTMVPQSVSLDKAVYKDFIFNKLLPDIAAKCPWQMRKDTIWIQHDNAPPHRVDEDELKERCQELGVDCRFYFQPAQSPDLNICDLSFFPAIQSLFHKIETERTLVAIMSAVLTAFEKFSSNSLNRAFLSLLMNYNLVLQHDGGNLYKLPHMGKEKLEKKGELPFTIKVWEPEATGNEMVLAEVDLNLTTIENDPNPVESDNDDAGWLLFLDNDVGTDGIEDCFLSALDVDPDYLVEQIIALENEEEEEENDKNEEK